MQLSKFQIKLKLIDKDHSSFAIFDSDEIFAHGQDIREFAQREGGFVMDLSNISFPKKDGFDNTVKYILTLL